MREFKVWIHEIKQSNMNREVPMEIVKLLNEIIMKGAPSTIVEVMRQQVRELSQVIQTDQFATDISSERYGDRFTRDR